MSQPFRKPGKSWRRAGIIPFWFDSNTQEYSFLLGQEHYEPGWSGSFTWTDFGGLSEKQDLSVAYTAAREAYEESMGLFGSIEELLEIIQISPEIKIHGGTTFFVNFWAHYGQAQLKLLPIFFERFYNYVSECIKFEPIKKPHLLGCPEGFIEKMDIHWFSETTLKEYVAIKSTAIHPLTIKAINIFLEKVGRSHLL